MAEGRQRHLIHAGMEADLCLRFPALELTALRDPPGKPTVQNGDLVMSKGLEHVSSNVKSCRELYKIAIYHNVVIRSGVSTLKVQ